MATKKAAAPVDEVTAAADGLRSARLSYSEATKKKTQLEADARQALTEEAKALEELQAAQKKLRKAAGDE